MAVTACDELIHSWLFPSTSNRDVLKGDVEGPVSRLNAFPTDEGEYR
jgi:hypothetical protein